MRLGDSARLSERLKTLGLSGSPNTASVERLNLTLRHALAALPHHSWATAQLTGELLARLIWANVRAWGAIEDKMIRR